MKEVGIEKIIRVGYDILDLITFYTVVGKEMRAWTVRKQTPVVKAAGKIHSDMERGFIKAEVIPYETFSRSAPSMRRGKRACEDRGEGVYRAGRGYTPYQVQRVIAGRLRAAAASWRRTEAASRTEREGNHEIYFPGSIRAGREDAGVYGAMITWLRSRGEVLTGHVGSAVLSDAGEDGPDDRTIHDRDMAWLTACDLVVAEVSRPSLGVGYELGWAAALGKPVLCLYQSHIRTAPLGNDRRQPRHTNSCLFQLGRSRDDDGGVHRGDCGPMKPQRPRNAASGAGIMSEARNGVTALELLAPAGNAEIGMAAIDHGADAVYIGAPKFSARPMPGSASRTLRG